MVVFYSDASNGTQEGFILGKGTANLSKEIFPENAYPKKITQPLFKNRTL